MSVLNDHCWKLDALHKQGELEGQVSVTTDNNSGPRPSLIKLPLVASGTRAEAGTPAPPPRRSYPLEATSRPIDHATRPIYAVWEITLKCDLGCRHCGSRAGRSRPQELTTSECFDLIDQMSSFGLKEVTLIGGEAYLRPDFTELVQEIRRHGMDCTMTTGGRGITEERAKQAAAAGLQSVSVSLDGLADTHDHLRGAQGSFRAALNAVSLLRDAGIAVAVNTQINRRSQPELGALLQLLINNRCHSWQLQLTVPMGRAADNPELMLQPFELIALFEQLKPLVDRAKQSGVRVLPGNNLGYFGPLETVLRAHTLKGHAGGCGAGRATLGIEADGTLKGCPSLQTADWAGGNILDTSLSEVWERSKAFRYTRDRTIEDLWGYCRSCYYADACRAGCTWMGHSLFGRPGNNPYCHHRALEMRRAGVRERVVLKERAPGLPFDRGLFELVEEPYDESVPVS